MHGSEGRKGLRAHKRDGGRREGRTTGLGGKKERPKELTKEGEREGKRRKWVRQADRQWRLLQLDTAD